MSRFDTIIVGGGAAGMVAGIALAERGQRVALFSSGRSSLSYFSGSFELFAEGLEGVERLATEGGCGHPYATIGTERIVRYTKQIKEIFATAGIPLRGEAERNMLRLTPLGVLKPAWLSPKEFATFESADNLASKRVCVVGIEGYLDFNPEFVAQSLRHRVVECECYTVRLSEQVRSGAVSPITTNAAQELAQRVSEVAGDSDLVLLPAIFDMYHREAFDIVQSIVGERVKLVPTASLSIVGASVQTALWERFVMLGGELFEGDRVVALDVECGVAKSIHTAAGATFEADNFVLATGSFFGGGVVGSHAKIYEPLADLDVTAAARREEWTSAKLFGAQPFEQFGVGVDGSLHPSKGGVTLRNLYAVGSILAGSDGVKEGSGGGVALCSALMAAELIAE